MKPSERRFKKHRITISISLLVVLLIGIIPVRMAIADFQTPYPQAILTLGGGLEREQFTAEFAETHPSLPIWVSSGSSPKEAAEVFRNAGISTQRVHLDYRASDTVTNFTSLVEDFKRQHIQHIYLITSDFHMPRSKVIATFVLGSRGITFTSVSIPSNHSSESPLRILRDSGRSILWIVTGRTGASLRPYFACLLYSV